MKHLIRLFLTFVFSLPTTVLAKTGITVPRFADKTEKGRCPQATAKAKADLERELQARLIDGLMGLNRFEVQEREVSPVRLKHKIVGTLRNFEVCAFEGHGQKVQIALEVHVHSSKGMTHMFSSRAETASTAQGRAPAMAVDAAINEIVKRVDGAIPRKKNEVRLGYKSSDSSPILVRLLPRDRR